MTDYLFMALGQRTKFLILQALLNGELCACELPFLIKKTQSNTSMHLIILKIYYKNKSLCRLRMLLIQELQYRAAQLVITRIVGQRQAVARLGQIDGENFADGGGRAVGHHHDAV